MSVALIYSTTTGRLRRIVIPSEGAAVGRGEATYVATDQDYGSTDPQTLVSAATGITPSNDRYAAVGGDGFVTLSLIADPLGCGDAIDGLTLIQHAIAGPRWFLEVDGRWTAPPSPRPRRHILRRYLK